MERNALKYGVEQVKAQDALVWVGLVNNVNMVNDVKMTSLTVLTKVFLVWFYLSLRTAFTAASNRASPLP